MNQTERPYGMSPYYNLLSNLSPPIWVNWWVFVKCEPKSSQLKEPKTSTTSVCVHWIYLIHKFHNLSWITEINELFHNILIYWDAPVLVFIILGYTQLCDWWSVGVILYEMVVGQPPFLATAPLETQMKVRIYVGSYRWIWVCLVLYCNTYSGDQHD